MMGAVSLPLRRGLALAILLVIVALAWTLAIAPLVDLSRARWQDIAEMSGQLARLQAIIGRQPELVRRAAAAQDALTAEGGLWSGDSAAEVAAAMQDQLRKVIGGSGGQLRSTAVVSEANEHQFHRVTVHFTIVGVLDTVQKTLAAVQSARPAVFVDNVAIHATEAAGAARPAELTMDLDVSGYMAVAGK
jgi:general secretion pathway protein M